MGVIKKGLTVDGVNYFSDILSGDRKPEWMDFSKQIAALTGNYKLLDMTTGLTNLDRFLFKIPKWPIGGFYFDGIIRTEHVSRIRPTQYPVQTGVTMTDHAIIEPAELVVEIMMTDSHTTPFVSHNPFLDSIYNSLKSIKLYSNYMQAEPQILGDGRSARMWASLKATQISRIPITVETRLQTYENMLIEELSAPDDAKTFNALKCTVRLREIIIANVAETQVSARVAAAKEVIDGQTPANASGVKDTTINALRKSAGFVNRDWLGWGRGK